jgi:methanogenic corrinoid protein MtbC1
MSAAGATVTEPSPPNAPTLSIAATQRDTGLSKDTLRVWERRYGFPMPVRDGQGERAYTQADVDRLRLLKCLLDAGHRPGRVVPLPLAQLQGLAEQSFEQTSRAAEVALAGDDLHTHLELIRAHDAAGLRNEMTRQLSRLGVFRFVIEVVSPLNAAVGDAWVRGELAIFEEHLYTEAVQIVLRAAIASVPAPAATDSQRVLLSTLPGEPHGLGLLMAEAVLALEGCRCVSMGTQTPLSDIVLAAAALRSDIVALSFTGCMNANQVVASLTELRAKLPPQVAVWAGGSAPVLRRRPVAGVEALNALVDVPAAVRRNAMRA